MPTHPNTGSRQSTVATDGADRVRGNGDGSSLRTSSIISTVLDAAS